MVEGGGYLTTEADRWVVRQSSNSATARAMEDNPWAGSTARARDNVGVRKGGVEIARVDGRWLRSRRELAARRDQAEEDATERKKCVPSLIGGARALSKIVDRSHIVRRT
jgi:hypothetical protein